MERRTRLIYCQNLKIGLKVISDFSSENIEKEFKLYLEEKELGMGKLLPILGFL